MAVNVQPIFHFGKSAQAKISTQAKKLFRQRADTNLVERSKYTAAFQAAHWDSDSSAIAKENPNAGDIFVALSSTRGNHKQISKSNPSASDIQTLFKRYSNPIQKPYSGFASRSQQQIPTTTPKRVEPE